MTDPRPAPESFGTVVFDVPENDDGRLALPMRNGMYVWPEGATITGSRVLRDPLDHSTVAADELPRLRKRVADLRNARFRAPRPKDHDLALEHVDVEADRDKVLADFGTAFAKAEQALVAEIAASDREMAKPIANSLSPADAKAVRDEFRALDLAERVTAVKRWRAEGDWRSLEAVVAGPTAREMLGRDYPALAEEVAAIRRPKRAAYKANLEAMLAVAGRIRAFFDPQRRELSGRLESGVSVDALEVARKQREAERRFKETGYATILAPQSGGLDRSLRS